MDAALYRARIDGELLALSDGVGNPLGTINADRTLHQGLELGLGWRIADALAALGELSVERFPFRRRRGVRRQELAGVPPQQLRSELRWSAGERFYVAPNVEWAPQDYYIDHANTFRAPGYTVVGLRIGGRFASQWSWFADARNLADRKWIADTNVVADAKGRDGAASCLAMAVVLFGLEWRL